jgi:prepilin-type N-terminal cleavage/methylation domain-containing protein
MKTARAKRSGFTLIEMLVVITIIGIIAAMVLGLAGLASRKKKDSVASATVTRLVSMIENYHDKLGYYPPDNATSNYVNGAAYESSTALNQLFYELPGCAMVSASGAVATYQAVDGTKVTTPALVAAYQRGGIANANPDEPHNFYYPPPKTSDYATYPSPPPGAGSLEGLVVAVPGTNSSVPNFVHYDSSSANRHNPGRYDVWVEYLVGMDRTTGAPVIITNGNW